MDSLKRMSILREKNRSWNRSLLVGVRWKFPESREGCATLLDSSTDHKTREQDGELGIDECDILLTVPLFYERSHSWYSL